MSEFDNKPTIAIFTGDPAGIGPEIVCKLLTNEQYTFDAKVILIGQACALAGCAFPPSVTIHTWEGLQDEPYPLAVANELNGRFQLKGLAEGVRIVNSGAADVFLFAPLNKSALHHAGMTEEDEMHYFASCLGYTGYCSEVNVLKPFWTARVTSHVALKSVSDLLTPSRIRDTIVLLYDALVDSGVTSPRIGVCGFNPHNGDNGNFGDEEITKIGPGIELARSEGFPCEGPFPADTIFLRAKRVEDGFDGVVTMFHDQGQIAIKMMNFWEGITYHVGLPIPALTPAHGTAYDIAGKGIANPNAFQCAFELAAKLGAAFQVKRRR